MPIRDFICEECGHQFEEIVGFYDDVKCPHCESGGNPKALPSAPGSYRIKGDNSASTRPKGGAFKKGK